MAGGGLMRPEAARLFAIKKTAVEKFSAGNWIEIGVMTNCSDLVENDARLLRSLSFGDDDYEGTALHVLRKIGERDPDNLEMIEGYIASNFRVEVDAFAGSDPTRPGYLVQPTVFQIPTEPPDKSLLSAMMPFSSDFNGVYEAIKGASISAGLDCKRADDVWEHTTIIQDVFTLIFRSFIVVCDFSGKNTNVFYECGIAHALGKHVVPIAQHMSEIPFDLQQHRAIIYSPNREGLSKLQDSLHRRLKFLTEE